MRVKRCNQRSLDWEPRVTEFDESEVTAFPGVLLLDGRVFYFAILMREDVPIEDEQEIYRHRDRLALYGDGELLGKHLAQDAIFAEQDIFDVIDLDGALQALKFSVWTEVEIDAVLTAWNGLEDLMLALGLPFEFRGELANVALEKLFWGLNLPSVTPAGCHYVPIWRKKERRKIARALRTAASRVRGLVVDVAAQPLDSLRSARFARQDIDDGGSQLPPSILALQEPRLA